MCGGSRHTSALAQKETQLDASFTNERVLFFPSSPSPLKPSQTNIILLFNSTRSLGAPRRKRLAQAEMKFCCLALAAASARDIPNAAYVSRRFHTVQNQELKVHRS